MKYKEIVLNSLNKTINYLIKSSIRKHKRISSKAKHLNNNVIMQIRNKAANTALNSYPIRDAY